MTQVTKQHSVVKPKAHGTCLTKQILSRVELETGNGETKTSRVDQRPQRAAAQLTRRVQDLEGWQKSSPRRETELHPTRQGNDTPSRRSNKRQNASTSEMLGRVRLADLYPARHTLEVKCINQ